MVDFNESRFLMFTFGGSLEGTGSANGPCPLAGTLLRAAAPASWDGVALDVSAPHRTVPVPVWAKEDGADVVTATSACDTAGDGAMDDDSSIFGGAKPMPVGGTLPAVELPVPSCWAPLVFGYAGGITTCLGGITSCLEGTPWITSFTGVLSFCGVMARRNLVSWVPLDGSSERPSSVKSSFLENPTCGV